ncbi:phosphomannomutase, partial [Yangia sp. PrR002]|nr:phosphomannomutase [Salipiger sp. PrR002]NDW59835.1 phosphomannomutase [Salipiger sp. PrR004]
RDCMLPLITVLIAAGEGTVSERVAQEPSVVTMADRLQEVPQEASQPFVAKLREDAGARAEFLSRLGAEEAGCDLTDGVRMTLPDGRIVHVRPSGNAPELRLYVEASDRAGAEELMERGLVELRSAVRG